MPQDKVAELEAEVRWHVQNGMRPGEHKASARSLESSIGQLEASSATKRICLENDVHKVSRVCAC